MNIKGLTQNVEDCWVKLSWHCGFWESVGSEFKTGGTTELLIEVVLALLFCHNCAVYNARIQIVTRRGHNGGGVHGGRHTWLYLDFFGGESTAEALADHFSLQDTLDWSRPPQTCARPPVRYIPVRAVWPLACSVGGDIGQGLSRAELIRECDWLAVEVGYALDRSVLQLRSTALSNTLRNRKKWWNIASRKYRGVLMVEVVVDQWIRSGLTEISGDSAKQICGACLQRWVD